MKKILFGLCIVIVLSYWTIRPLLVSGYFPMHDDTQIGRVVAMGKAMRAGQFPVRWVSDLGYGYGYPIFNFYAPLPYYVGGFFYMLGLPGLLSTKIMFGLGMILAGVSMYAVVAGLLGVSAGVVAGIFYAYAPYHAVQLYVRGAVGELWAVIFFPWIFWALLRMQRQASRRRALLVGGLALAATILSHNILGYVAIAGVAVAAVSQATDALIRHKKMIPVLDPYVRVLIIALGLSAFFWLPALAEMRYTSVAEQIGGSADFRDHFVCIEQLWSSVWAFGGSAKGCASDGLSFMLGKLHILAGTFAVLWIAWRRQGLTLSGQMTLAAAVITAVSAFFMLSVSGFVWDVLPLASYVQYPWRLLAVSTFGASVLTGVAITLAKRRVLRLGVAVVLTVAAIAYYSKWFAPQYTYVRDPHTFESTEELRFRVSRVSDEYLPPELSRPRQISEIVRDTIPKSDLFDAALVVDTDTYMRYDINAKERVSLLVRKAYFPGWRYLVNGKEVTPQVQGSLPTVELPQGYDVLELKFTDTPVRALGNWISLMSAGVLIYLYGKQNKKTNA